MVLHFSRFISFQRVSLKVWSPETTSLYVFDAFFSISAIIRKIIYTKTIHQITIYSFVYEDSIFFWESFNQVTVLLFSWSSSVIAPSFCLDLLVVIFSLDLCSLCSSSLILFHFLARLCWRWFFSCTFLCSSFSLLTSWINSPPFWSSI